MKTNLQDTLQGQLYLLNQGNLNALNNLKQAVKSAFNAVWSNPYFTPTQMVEGMGADAVANFTDFSNAQSAIKLLDPSYTLLVPPVLFTAHEDGTITLSTQ